MAISRSQMERQLRNMGGIMSLQQPRQGYFLGKLVKKAAKAVKKVVKSPIGKAAILGALTFGIPGTQFSGLAGGKGLAGLKGKLFGLGGRDAFMGAGPTKGLFGKLGLTKGAGSLGLTGLGKIASIGGLSGLAGLMAAGEQDEEEVDLTHNIGVGDLIRFVHPNGTVTKSRITAFKNSDGTERDPELDEILSIFIVLFDEKYGGESNELK